MKSDRNQPADRERRLLSRRSVLTSLGAVPVLTVAAFVIGATEASAAAANINPSAPKQTIKGFGAMVHAAWMGDLTAAQRTPRHWPMWISSAPISTARRTRTSPTRSSSRRVRAKNSG